MPAQLRRELGEGCLQSFDSRKSALCHVLAASAAPAEGCEHFLHEPSHVERLPVGLSKY
jgi:hypothetical protein